MSEDKYGDIKGPHAQPGEFVSTYVDDPKIQPKWKIPEILVVKAALSGGNFYTKETSPHFPVTLDDIRKEAEECILAGASGIHFDHQKFHVQDSSGKKRMTWPESYHCVIDPLKATYGSKFVVDCNILNGDNFREQAGTVFDGLTEISYINIWNSPRWVETAIDLLQERGAKPEIIVCDTAQLELAHQRLIKTGILRKPYYFIVLVAAPLQIPRRRHFSMPNEKAMCNGLLYLVERIKEIDDTSFIMVCASGRASSYLTTLATILGLHVRVGLEDTVWKYPHKDEYVTSNADEVRRAIEIGKLLGRRVATGNEYRDLIGVPKK